MTGVLKLGIRKHGQRYVDDPLYFEPLRMPHEVALALDDPHVAPQIFLSRPTCWDARRRAPRSIFAGHQRTWLNWVRSERKS